MKQILLFLTLLLSLTAFGQTGQKNFIDQNYIEVKGTSEIEVSPDRIFINILINEKEHKGKPVNDVEKLMVEKLTAMGMDIQKQLSIRDFVSNLKNNWILKSEIQSIKQYELLVSDAETVGKVFKELNNLGISSISIDRLESSEIDKHKREAKSKAIKQAKENAETLAQAVGQEIGRALLISEEDYLQNIAGNLQGRVAGVKIRGASSSSWNWEAAPEIEFEKIKIEYQIKVLFELK
jgi:uncharacterized protein YggE